MAKPHPASTNDRTVCVLLRRLAFHHLCLAGPILRVPRDGRRPDETAFHHGGIFEFRIARSARSDFDEEMDPAAWRKTMADASSADLRQRRGRRGPLFLEGEVGCATADDLRGRFGLPSWIPRFTPLRRPPRKSDPAASRAHRLNPLRVAGPKQSAEDALQEIDVIG